MIFAEIEEETSLEEILNLLKQEFLDLEFGQQGDSWVWVSQEDMKVAIDTFTNVNFEIKADSSSSTLANSVIMLLGKCIKLQVFEKPKLEAHE